MAGQPKKQAIIEELTNRAHVEMGDDASPLDYACMYLENGKTFTQLVDDLSAKLGWEVYRARALNILRDMDATADVRLSEARRASARALAEQTVDIIDDADDASREKLQHAKMRADVRQWIAARFNPAEFGEQRGASVSITLNTAHLDALRMPEPATARIQNPPPVEAVDAEVVELPQLGTGDSVNGDSKVSGA